MLLQLAINKNVHLLLFVDIADHDFCENCQKSHFPVCYNRTKFFDREQNREEVCDLFYNRFFKKNSLQRANGYQSPVEGWENTAR